MKKTALLFALCFACVSLFACGSTDSSSSSSSSSKAETSSAAASEAEQTSETTEAAATEAPAETTEAAQDEPTEAAIDAPEDATEEQNEGGEDAITEDQALNAVKKYYETKNPGQGDAETSAEVTTYWTVSTNENNEIVVLYRAYTGAQIRYYVDPASGDTYSTEYVPGIIDEEQRTDESFNVKDYLD